MKELPPTDLDKKPLLLYVLNRPYEKEKKEAAFYKKEINKTMLGIE